VSQVVQAVRYQTDCGSTVGPVLKLISKEFKKSLVGKWMINEDGSTTLLTYPELEKLCLL
jgi:hypothetical protein